MVYKPLVRNCYEAIRDLFFLLLLGQLILALSLLQSSLQTIARFVNSFALAVVSELLIVYVVDSFARLDSFGLLRVLMRFFLWALLRWRG
jgi:hypothetical protein